VGFGWYQSVQNQTFCNDGAHPEKGRPISLRMSVSTSGTIARKKYLFVTSQDRRLIAASERDGVKGQKECEGSTVVVTALAGAYADRAIMALHDVLADPESKPSPGKSLSVKKAVKSLLSVCCDMPAPESAIVMVMPLLPVAC
jgi:hypothetical protein